jgi:hypothetical protein
MARDRGCPSPIRWEIVLKKLHRYALGRAGVPKKSNRDGPTEYMIGDASAASDIVSRAFEEVVEKLLNNDLGLDGDEPLTEAHALNLLKQIVRERLVDLRRRIEVRKTDYAEEIKRGSEDGETEADFFDSYKVRKTQGFKRHQMLSDPLPPPDQGDEEATYREQLKAIYDRVKGDRELEEMIKAICEQENLRWPRDIAAHLNTSVEDIYNRLKRLRTRFDYLRPQRRKKAV